MSEEPHNTSNNDSQDSFPRTERSLPFRFRAYAELKKRTHGEEFDFRNDTQVPLEFPSFPDVTAQLCTIAGGADDDPAMAISMNLYAHGEPTNPRANSDNDQMSHNNDYLAFFGAEMPPIIVSMRDASDTWMRMGSQEYQEPGYFFAALKHTRELTDTECENIVEAVRTSTLV